MNNILAAREKRSIVLQEINYEINDAIIIKANIPGSNKNIKVAKILVTIFKNEVIKQVKVKTIKFYESDDGPFYLLTINKMDNTKLILIKIEEKHPLGRLIDLDLFTSTSRSIYRSDVGYGPRKCMICDRLAILCVREQKHPTVEVLNFINHKVSKYLEELFYELAFSSIKSELDLEDKFGLVTPTSNGSHGDMDYNLMLSSLDAVVPGLVKMGMIGYESSNLSDAYKEAKQVGIITEKEMLDITNGVNTYKGLIFILGLAMISCGYYLSNGLDSDIFKNIQIMTKGVFSEPKYHTFGEYAYKKYLFTGARGEAKDGFPTVKKVYEYLQGATIINNRALHMALIQALSLSDDTVLLKRAGSMEKYQYFKNLISSIKVYDIKTIKKITKQCIDNNISCGGAADILITALFSYKFKKLF